MSKQVTLEVRPGFVHGASRQYQAGDRFTVPAAEAVQLLAAFGDKLKEVSSVTLQVSGDTSPALETETPEPIQTKRARKDEAL